MVDREPTALAEALRSFARPRGRPRMTGTQDHAVLCSLTLRCERERWIQRGDERLHRICELTRQPEAIVHFGMREVLSQHLHSNLHGCGSCGECFGLAARLIAALRRAHGENGGRLSRELAKRGGGLPQCWICA